MVLPDVRLMCYELVKVGWVMLGKLDVLNAFLTYNIFKLQWVYSDINNKTSQFSSMAFYFHVLLLLKRFSKFQVINISCVGYFFFFYDLILFHFIVILFMFYSICLELIMM